VLRQVAEGVLIHQSEFCQSNAVVVHGGAGVLLIDPGVHGYEMAALANDLSDSGQPVMQGSRRIRIGTTSSGAPGSAWRPGTARRAARPLSEFCCRTRAGRPASPSS